MRITFCGVRGSTPAPGAGYARYGGNTSCVAVAHSAVDTAGDSTSCSAGAPVLLLDAGTGLGGVTGLLGGDPFRGTILLTHLHWDHCLGLPFFRGGDRDDARVTLLLPDQGEEASGGSAGAERLLSRVMSPPFFPITPRQLRGEWTFGAVSPGQFKAEGFTVEAREIPHKGGRTLGYRVSDGRRVLAYVTDHCPTALGPGADGLGAYHEGVLDLAADADRFADAPLPVLVAAEGQTFELFGPRSRWGWREGRRRSAWPAGRATDRSGNGRRSAVAQGSADEGSWAAQAAER